MQGKWTGKTQIPKSQRYCFLSDFLWADSRPCKSGCEEKWERWWNRTDNPRKDEEDVAMDSLGFFPVVDLSCVPWGWELSLPHTSPSVPWAQTLRMEANISLLTPAIPLFDFNDSGVPSIGWRGSDPRAGSPTSTIQQRESSGICHWITLWSWVLNFQVQPSFWQHRRTDHICEVAGCERSRIEYSFDVSFIFVTPPPLLPAQKTPPISLQVLGAGFNFWKSQSCQSDQFSPPTCELSRPSVPGSAGSGRRVPKGKVYSHCQAKFPQTNMALPWDLQSRNATHSQSLVHTLDLDHLGWKGLTPSQPSLHHVEAYVTDHQASHLCKHLGFPPEQSVPWRLDLNLMQPYTPNNT